MKLFYGEFHFCLKEKQLLFELWLSWFFINLEITFFSLVYFLPMVSLNSLKAIWTFRDELRVVQIPKISLFK